MEKILNNRWIWWGISILSFVIYFLPYFDLQNCVIRIHDNLDSYYLYYHILSTTDALFYWDPHTPVDNIMNGIPRFCLPSSLHIVTWMFVIFGSQAGYVINHLVVHLIGFGGMYLLLKSYFLREEKDHYLTVLLALCYGLLPVFSVWGLSLFGQPLLLYALLKIKEGAARYYHWLTVFLFPFYSFFVFAGFFIMLVLGFWIVLDTYKAKKLNLNFFGAAILLGIIHLIVDYQLFYGMLFSDSFESHRTTIFEPTLNFKGVLTVGFFTFMNGWYHSANFFGFLLIGVIFISLGIGLIKQWNIRNLSIMLTVSGASALLYAVMDWDQLRVIFDQYPILNKFSLKRIHFLLPTFVFLTFTLALQNLKRLTYASYLMLAILVPLLSMNFQLKTNFEQDGYNMDFFKVMDRASASTITYSEYFDEALYEDIHVHIGKAQETYRVAALGIEPTTLQFNGFFTLDSYQNLYRRKHSILFYQINEQEFAKTGHKKEKQMGNRCYLFSADVYNGKEQIEDLDLNMELLKSQNCQYIFSKYEILNPQVAGLMLEKKFVSDKNPKGVYLYALI